MKIRDILTEFAPGGSGGNGPFDYGAAIIKIGETFVDHYQDSAAGEDAAMIIAVGETFMNRGMMPGIKALFELDTQVYDHVLDELADEGFNVEQDIIAQRRKIPRDPKAGQLFAKARADWQAQAGEVYQVTGRWGTGSSVGQDIKARSEEEARRKFLASNPEYKFKSVDVKRRGGAAGVAEGAIDIGSEWMSDTELDQYVPDQLEQEWRELVGYDAEGNVSALWANITGGYEPDANDPEDRANMVKVANKWFAMKRIPNVRFFDVRDADDELEWLVQIGSQGVSEDAVKNLSVEQLATISDAALDQAYGYGRSQPGGTFGWQANLQSAAQAKKMIDAGITDIERIADAIHRGWNVTAQKFVTNPDQFADTEKLRAAGKLEAKLDQRAKLMRINYAQLPDDEQEKDRVVARALLQALQG